MMKSILTVAACSAFIATATYGQELAINGDFETGDLTGWEFFPNGATASFTPVMDPNSGVWAGEVLGNSAPGNAVVKQTSVGIGEVMIGDTVDVSLFIKGETANGGVVFFEFFQEQAGGGASGGSGVIAVPVTDQYTEFTYSQLIDGDVTLGVTVQLTAVTGGDVGSLSNFTVDDVSIVVPEPASLGLLGLGGLGLVRRRRA